MADFQEMQTILGDMVEEHEELRDYVPVCDVRPRQALHFMSQVIFSLNPRPGSLNHKILTSPALKPYTPKGVGSNNLDPDAWTLQVMYSRRSKQNPMWMTALFGGWGKPCGLDLSPTLEDTDVFKERSFLGQVDMHGTPLESNVFATGIGNYIALPLLRSFTKEYERMEAG